MSDVLPGPSAGALVPTAGAARRGVGAARRVDLDREQPAFDGFRTVLATLADTIEANRPGVVDDLDPEFLHDFRVAVRRTRSVLGHARGVLPPDVRSWASDTFRELGVVTGPARDLDVLALEWDDLVAPFDAVTVAALEPARALVGRRRARAHAQLSAALAGRTHAEAVGRWRAWLDDPEATRGGRADRRLGDVVADRIERAQHRLLRDGRVIDDQSPAEALHALRKDTKKLRYLFECFAGILPGGPRRHFEQRLERLQDLLGEHQDAEVQVGRLTGIARELHAAAVGPDTLVAIGRLVEVQAGRCRSTRATFSRTFSAYDCDRTRSVLDRVLRTLR